MPQLAPINISIINASTVLNDAEIRPVVEALRAHQARQEAERTTARVWRNPADLVFTSTIGTPLDPEVFGKSVPRICKAAGLGHWSIHELRHSCASLLLAMGVPLEVVSDTLGRVDPGHHGRVRTSAGAGEDAGGRCDAASVVARRAAGLRSLGYKFGCRRWDRNTKQRRDLGFGGAPGSRSRHLGIKRAIPAVQTVRPYP